LSSRSWPTGAESISSIQSLSRSYRNTAGQTVLKQALKVGDEPVSAPIVVGGKIMVMSSTGPVVINGSVLSNFVVGTSTPANNGVSAEPFKILGWTEL